MGFIEWTPALDIGVGEIDRQHRELVARINALSDAIESGRDGGTSLPLLDALAAYARDHFTLEEGWFAEFGYPAAVAHTAEHRDFIAKVSAFREAFAADEGAGGAALPREILAFLRDWLVRHISYSDRKYRSLFKSRGL